MILSLPPPKCLCFPLYDAFVHSSTVSYVSSLKLRVACPASPCEIYGEQSGNGTGFSPIISVFPYKCDSTSAPYSSSSSHTLISSKRTAQGLRTFKRRDDLSDMWKYWTEQYFRVV